MLGTLRHLLKDFWSDCRKYWLACLLVLLALALGSIALFPNDAQFLAKVRLPEDSVWHRLAGDISYWGDFPTGIVLFGIALWTLGWILKKVRWQRLALGCVLAAAIAGIFVNCFRLTLGRPRPSAGIADGFYGIRKSPDFHGFPSGHAATAYGWAGAIAVAHPPLAAPILLAATTVPWARMQLNRHYPSDVIVGGGIGLMAGVLMGLALRRQSLSSS